MLTAMSDDLNAPAGPPHAGTGPRGEAPGPGAPGATRRPLRRDRDAHMVAGVCGGLGRSLDMDPVIFRILFGVLIFFGGFGILTYAAIWLFVPMDGESRTEAQKLLAGQSVLVAAAASVLLLLGVLALANTPTGGLRYSSPIIVLAAAVAAVPVLRARRRRARGGGAGSAPGGWGPAAGPGPATPEAWWQHKNATAVAGPAAPGAAPPDGQEIQDAPPEPTGGPHTGASAPWAHTGPYPGPEAPGLGPYTPPAPPTPRLRRVGGLAMAAALVALGIGGVLASSGAVHLGWARGAALTVLVLGAAMALGGLFGSTRWLIPLGVLAAVPLILVTALRMPLQGQTGTVSWAPATSAALASPYQLAAGRGTLDLTSLDPHGRTVDVTAQVGAGKLLIIVPDGDKVEAHVHLGMAQIQFLGDQSFAGLDVTTTLDAPAAGPSGGTIALTLNVGAGDVEVDRAN
jgi:phage shock protein PspC (stress-responsive transcriptional regulator)